VTASIIVDHVHREIREDKKEVKITSGIHM
jgi:hypothetical protein